MSDAPLWHSLSREEVLARLQADPEKGLTSTEVAERRARFGLNRLTPKATRPAWLLFLLQFHQPLVYILIVSGLISGMLGEWVDALVIWAVVLLNAVVGYLQESKAAKAIDALSGSMVSETTVLRDGAKLRIPAPELVPGDLVLLAGGDQVPADLRLVRVRDLRVAEAALTGESVPVEKNAEILPPETGLADRTNLAFATALVTFGSAAGIVVETGDRTEVGKISGLIHSATEIATPLTREIARFSGWLLNIILALAGLTFLVGLARGEAFSDMFHAAVALSVAAIPEGLPSAVTIVLAIGVARMARRNVIIRRLPAVETLGGTTVICSDKTGTLTENQMTVQRLFAAGRWFTASGVGYAPGGEIVADDGGSLEAIRELLVAGVKCNDSVLAEHEGLWEVQGDPTEGALLVAAGKLGLKTGVITAESPRIDAIPFESEFQYMATLHRGVAYMKGSVEKILGRCEGVDQSAVQAAAEQAGREGLRVLAFATKRFDEAIHDIGHRDIESGLTFLGLQAMIDPPRPEAVHAVASCRQAGIRVKMITGDHATTAAAIARRIGLVAENDKAESTTVYTGAELATLSDDALCEVADKVSVFARVSPEQKLRLVRALQTRGAVVAMTGDGVNDAPALKQADIGVAMGITGTDVAKDSAAMILTDDNFASIEAAVEEGRGVFDNLSKFLAWTLPTNLGEGLVILVAILFGASLPILPVQVLWINLTTGILLGMMLTFEPKEAGLMLRPPRNSKESFLTPRLLVRIGLVGLVLLVGGFGLFEWEQWRGHDETYARTVAVNVFVFVEILYLFSSRSLRRSLWEIDFFSNVWLLWGVVGMTLLQLGITYLSPMNKVFHTAPIGLDSWLAVIAVSVAAVVVVEIEKSVEIRSDARHAIPR